MRFRHAFVLLIIVLALGLAGCAEEGEVQAQPGLGGAETVVGAGGVAPSTDEAVTRLETRVAELETRLEAMARRMEQTIAQLDQAAQMLRESVELMGRMDQGQEGGTLDENLDRQAKEFVKENLRRLLELSTTLLERVESELNGEANATGPAGQSAPPGNGTASGPAEHTI